MKMAISNFFRVFILAIQALSSILSNSSEAEKTITEKDSMMAPSPEDVTPTGKDFVMSPSVEDVNPTAGLNMDWQMIGIALWLLLGCLCFVVTKLQRSPEETPEQPERSKEDAESQTFHVNMGEEVPEAKQERKVLKVDAESQTKGG